MEDEMGFTFKDWNQQQKRLRTALENPDEHDQAISACLEQHGWTHESAVWPSPTPTFADQLWQDLSEPDARTIPPKSEHSIAWTIWHLARIEDTALNLLVAGSSTVLDQGGWQTKMKVTARDTGNLMPQAEIKQLSKQIDLQVLRDYRVAVGLRTRQIIQSLTQEKLGEKVSPADIQQIRQQELVRPDAEDLLAYWSRRTIRGLLLMPATRHNMVHINEALTLKKKLT
jgi:hypothetical protein